MTEKKCSKCGETKPLDEFYSDRSKAHGRSSRCKECSKQASRLYREAHLEQVKEGRRRYYEENRDRLLAKHREYAAENRDAIRSQRRVYYLENREALLAEKVEYHRANAEAIREKVSAWRRGNPELIQKYKDENPHKPWEHLYRTRARRYGFEPVIKSFTREELFATYGEECYLCGGPFEELDHVIEVHQGGEHSLENCRPCCSGCNNKKSLGLRGRSQSGQFLPRDNHNHLMEE